MLKVILLSIIVGVAVGGFSMNDAYAHGDYHGYNVWVNNQLLYPAHWVDGYGTYSVVQTPYEQVSRDIDTGKFETNSNALDNFFWNAINGNNNYEDIIQKIVDDADTGTIPEVN